ncbi:hypothetical protein AXG93_1406s1210 [Marchantia polymorpha subsp. ruderalis]|uniref:Glycoside hydrolase family 31 TIM barrel domain-containing protein n=1 Tax=Marchantia polymorpha subsp. ruderalis TaxID=1480154 RepID=A0A176W0E9_MARPO|nr:hypothetical protein AXG93_1406s1210 [Marchantia polymorpha subsp. ruderalis]
MKKNPKSGSRRFNNPFPKAPAGLGFVRGDLLVDAASAPSQSHTAGQGFEVRWQAEPGRAGLQVFHATEPERALWSTIPGSAFVSAAFGTDSFEESRGSFAIHDTIDVLCCHQTVEQVTIAWPSETFVAPKRPPSQVDADGVRPGSRGPCVIVAGCLYSDPKLAREQFAAFRTLSSSSSGPTAASSPSSPFYHPSQSHLRLESRGCLRLFSQEQRVAVRYWLVFFECRDHQLGFSVSLQQPARFETFCQAGAYVVARASSAVVPEAAHDPKSRTTTTTLNRSLSGDDFESEAREHGDGSGEHWLWSEAPVSAFGRRAVGNDGAEPRRLHSFGRKRSFRRSISVADFRTCSLFDKCLTGSSSFLAELANAGRVLTPREQQLVQLPRLNRIQITFSSDPSERFFGFGEQFSHFNLKGKRVPILVQEQGLGRGDQPITALANMVSNRSGGAWHTTYAPVPYYITSQMRSLYLEGFEYSVFDLTRSNAVQVQVHAGYMQGRILHGKTPADIIRQYTAAIGRMRELPAWITQGAIVGMQGGMQAVRKVWQKLRDLDVPLAAFWLQDWVGQRRTSIGWQLWWNWEVDRDHYPGWEQLVTDLRSHGIRTMAYCNPLLAPTHEKPNRRRDLLAEAHSQDLVVTDQLGSPYMIPNTSFDAAMVDLTNPAARTWLKNILLDMIQTGVRGWMADFGEALPLDCSLYSGEEARTVHNQYSELWAQLNREVAEEWEATQKGRRLDEGEDEDEKLVFFMRAGYRGSPRSSTLFWEGDQMVSWQRHDGIKSAVTGLLSGGLCGFSLNHSDIGGYCTVDIPLVRYRRSEELLLRWMELNAFSTIFRTHEVRLLSPLHR